MNRHCDKKNEGVYDEAFGGFRPSHSKSFGKGILDEVVKASVDKGAEVRIKDLYELGVDPVLKPADFAALQNGKVSDDIAVEQEQIKWADVITFIYPVWWAGVPAILKGYVDRVFSNGFAFRNTTAGPEGLLKGKSHYCSAQLVFQAKYTLKTECIIP